MGGQSLRRRQNGGQGAAKAFGAVKKWVKMAQWAQKKTEKLTVPPARSSIWSQSLRRGRKGVKMAQWAQKQQQQKS